MKHLRLAGPGERLSVLCIGSLSDDIEIGAGATILGWTDPGAGQLLKAWMASPKVRELIRNRVTPI
jgi:LmbE family N-acetylglucosaminyl deacetylase